MEAHSVRKIVVDSRFRRPESRSTSDFKFELSRAITLPRRCAGFITDIHLTHSWTNIDQHNRFLYYFEAFGPSVADTRVKRLELPLQNYTGTSLAAMLQTLLHAQRSDPGLGYIVTYDAASGTIQIGITGGQIRVLTDAELATQETHEKFRLPSVLNDNTPIQYDRLSPKTLNHVLSNDGRGSAYVGPTEYDFSGTWIISATDTAEITATTGGYDVVRQPANTSLGLFTQAGTVLTRVSNGSTFTWNGTELVLSGGAAWQGTPTPTPVVRSGFLNLHGRGEPLYLASPNLTSFGTSLGPRGEQTFLRKINPDPSYGGFGHVIVDVLQNEQDYFVCGGSNIIKTLEIQLVNSYGEVVPLNGTNISFSIVFQDLA